MKDLTEIKTVENNKCDGCVLEFMSASQCSRAFSAYGKYCNSYPYFIFTKVVFIPDKLKTTKNTSNLI